MNHAARLAALGRDLAVHEGILIVTSPANVRYLTGFSGSNAAVVARPDGAVFLTDFRYLERAQPLSGFIEVRRGDLEAASEALRRGLRAAPEPPPWNPSTRRTYGSVHFYIGVQDFAEGRFAAAEARYRRALGYQPDFPEALFNLGLSLDRLGREQDACAAFGRAVGLRPEFYEAHREVALCGLRIGAPRGEVVRSLRAALSLRPAAPDAAHLRALLESLEAQTGSAGP